MRSLKELSVPCRMNVDGKWSDGCIHDVSDQGLLVSSVSPPALGTYVDIRRGTLVIIGRVVWSGGSRFGVRTQDPVSISALKNEPVLKRRPAAADRRGVGREASGRAMISQVEQSRRFSSAFQFICLAIIGIGIGCSAAIYCYQVLAAPIDIAVGLLDNAVT